MKIKIVDKVIMVPKHKAVKELSEIVKEHKKIDYDVQERMKAEKSLAVKIKMVDEVIMGPKHKVHERTAIFDPKTEKLLSEENEILASTLKYNIGVLTKNKVTTQDLPEVQLKNKDHEDIMKDKTKGEKLKIKTYKAVLKHIKKKNKNMFCHINKAGEQFKYAMFIYMSHLMNNELVPDTYDYTTWKGLHDYMTTYMERSGMQNSLKH